MKGLSSVSICFPVFCCVINKSFDATDSSSYLKFLLNSIDSNVDLSELEFLVLLQILDELRG
jgi:hypothetical protein